MSSEISNYLTANNIASAVAILTGIVGSITGIVSLIKVNKLKSLDLRMEHGRLQNIIQVRLDDINKLCEKADSSRKAIYSARGLTNSGSSEKWKAEILENKSKIGKLSEQFSKQKTVTSPLSIQNLEVRVIELHNIEQQIKFLTEAFKASIAEDDVDRERIFQMRPQR
ncbi:MAG: hypothetical protein K9G33_06055 [Sneathiella sp.]|nr:hypothetical protein [Sneathiella sp.]